jgi:hypothetical protein
MHIRPIIAACFSALVLFSFSANAAEAIAPADEKARAEFLAASGIEHYPDYQYLTFGRLWIIDIQNKGTPSYVIEFQEENIEYDNFMVLEKNNGTWKTIETPESDALQLYSFDEAPFKIADGKVHLYQHSFEYAKDNSSMLKVHYELEWSQDKINVIAAQKTPIQLIE